MLLGICIVFLLWLAASYWRMQQAMRWWFQQQAIDRAAQTDQIQNGLIQDLFAIRLSLQSLSSNQIGEVDLHQQTCLAKAEVIHHHLTNLSAVLTHPFLAESLPLAVQSSLNQWQSIHSQSQLQLDLPSEWQIDSLERNRTILTALETLLKIALPSALPETVLQVSLSTRTYIAVLAIKITYPDRLTRIAATRAKELKYLRYCFCTLMPGWCHFYSRSQVATWQFQWKR